MMATAINRKINWAVPYLVVAALASLGTSWVLKTPETSQKAATLDKVETQTLPQVTKKLAATQTALNQANCDKDKATDVAVQGILAANTRTAAAPDWSDLRTCDKVKPVAPVPVTKLIPYPPKS